MQQHAVPDSAACGAAQLFYNNKKSIINTIDYMVPALRCTQFLYLTLPRINLLKLLIHNSYSCARWSYLVLNSRPDGRTKFSMHTGTKFSRSQSIAVYTVSGYPQNASHSIGPPENLYFYRYLGIRVL